MRGPTVASSTGSSVMATAMDTNGMKKPATAMFRRNGTGTTSTASRLIATVNPENTTARPAAPTALRTAVGLSAPLSRSSRQRVTTSSA